MADLWSLVAGGAVVINGGALLLLYRQYCLLAAEAMEYAGLVIASLREEEGSVRVNPEALAGDAMDHLCRLSGMVRWCER